MKNIKNKLLTSIIGVGTALTLSYGTANADLFLLKDGSRIYNYSMTYEDSYRIIAKNKEGKEIEIKQSELKDYIFIKDGLDFEKEVDEETANKLEEIKLIEHWGEEKLGLPVSDNFIVYDTSFETNHVICYSDRLKLPETYLDMEEKSFNTKEETLEKKKELEAKGYDVFYRIIEANANAPTISKMLLESKLPRKLETVLHENMHDYLDHAMSYVNFPLDLDEAFACVVGDFGSLEYIAEKLGRNSDEHKYTVQKIKKEYDHAELIIEYYNKLDKVLKSNTTEEAKLKEKEKLMHELAEKRSELLGYKAEELNNPALAVYMTYSRFYPLIKKVYEKTVSVKETLKVSKELSKFLKTLPESEREAETETGIHSIRYLENYLNS